ncbi:MAG: hypothetical protein DMF72_19120 [Acidobacteria bacterium]|nr:MAG: hypothetical protein DMF72_19120 [Acidobacteriota bacterium]
MTSPLNQPAPKQPGETNYLPWILIGCGSIGLLAVLIVIIAAGIVYYRFPGSGATGPRRPRPGIFSRGDVKLVDDHGIQTVAKTWSSCTALAPSDWTIAGNEQRVGIGVDLASPDQSMSASYGIVAAPRTEPSLGQDYYGTGTPERFLQTMLEANGATGFALDNDTRSVEGYTLRYWRANMRGKPVQGFVLYQTFETDDPSSYIVAYHMGATDASKWEENKNVVYDVAASIRCTKHLFPAQESSTRRPQGSSKDQIEREMSRKREEATMGFQNVYSPSTGDHWEASYSDYNPTGPDGPGYYRRVGNSYEKLNEGFPPN